MEHDIRNAVKGFDKKLVSDIAKHLIDNMKLANINPKLLATSLDVAILPAIIFILACLGIITISAVGITEPYTGTLSSLDDIKENIKSSASKIFNYLLQNAHLFKTKEQADADQWLGFGKILETTVSLLPTLLKDRVVRLNKIMRKLNPQM